MKQFEALVEKLAPTSPMIVAMLLRLLYVTKMKINYI